MARHQHRGDGSGARDAGAGPARRARRRHRPGRRRRARHGAGRSLQRARRAGPRDHALRRAEVVRGDHARRRRRGVQRQPRDVRADLSPDLRIARRQPGPRHGRPPRAAGVDRRRGARVPHRPASRRSPSTWPASTRICRRSTASGARWPTKRLELASIENDLRRASKRSRNASSGAQRKADDALQQRLRDAKREIDRVVEDARAKAGALADAAASPRLVTRGGGIARRAACRPARPATCGRMRGPRSTPSPAVSATAATPATPARCCRRSRRRPSRSRRASASASPPGLEGVVTSVQGKTAEVSVNGKRLQGERRRPGRDRPAPARRRRSPSASTSTWPRIDGVGSERHRLHGARGDRAHRQVPRSGVLSELREVRVIHGHGTGQLRRALTAFLAEHPQVVRAAGAPPNQGGGGVTVVELKD